MARVAICCVFLMSALSACSSDDEPRFTTRCGVILDGRLFNPFKQADGVPVTIRAAADPHLVVVSRDEEGGRRILVKLVGVDNKVSDLNRHVAISYIESLDPKAVFYRAKNNCTESVEGGETIPGQVVTLDGRNLGEELVFMGLGSVDRASRCGTEVIESCYLALGVEGGERP